MNFRPIRARVGPIYILNKKKISNSHPGAPEKEQFSIHAAVTSVHFHISRADEATCPRWFNLNGKSRFSKFKIYLLSNRYHLVVNGLQRPSLILTQTLTGNMTQREKVFSKVCVTG